MDAADCLEALRLPASALVDQRVPKKTLAEHGAGTPSARRQIHEGIDTLRWVSALKPATVGIPAYRDPVREYVEIAVLHLTMRPAAKPTLLLPLIHRAVPYPTVLVSSDEAHTGFSLAHKRWSQGEKDQVVLDGEVVGVRIEPCFAGDYVASFRDSLSLGSQPRETLYDLYQGWIDSILALQTASLLGQFSLPQSRTHADARGKALRECTRLESEMASLRAAAARERQVPRQVEINLQLKRLADAHAAARARL